MGMSKRCSCAQNTHRETCSLESTKKGVASFGARRTRRHRHPNPAFYNDLLRNHGEGVRRGTCATKEPCPCLPRYLKWMKTDLIVFPVLQAREVHEDRVKLLQQNGPFAPQAFEVGHVIRQAVARSDKSFERVLRNLEFLQSNVHDFSSFSIAALNSLTHRSSICGRSGTFARIEVMAA